MDLIATTTALAGGVLIGLGAALLLLANGRLAGVGGIVAGVLQRGTGQWGWRAAFGAGLLAGGTVLRLLHPSAFAPASTAWPVLALAGSAVGFGTRLGGGCTSGHGICGVSRLSRRSLVATMTFMFTGAVVVGLIRLLGTRP